MKQQIDPKIIALIKAYHGYRGGKNIRIAGTIKQANGNEMYLVRFNNCSGKAYSSIDEAFCGKDGDYVMEMLSRPQEDEKKMLETALKMFT